MRHSFKNEIFEKKQQTMRKTAFLFIVSVALSANVFAQQGCNNNTPGWGASLGTVSFATDRIWTIGSQMWSDAVTATACNKTDFDGGYFRDAIFNADCRSSPGRLGKLFSWCAVMRFADELCPYPWRVPTSQDFINLDMALGGTGIARGQRDTIVRDRYINDWGTSFIGRTCSFMGVNVNATYWSQTERDIRLAYSLYFNPNNNHEGGGWNMPRAVNGKAVGMALRCVRDN